MVAGFAVEGVRLTLPSDDTATAVLGPRLSTEAVTGLRLLACPTSTAALMLAQAIDATVDTLTATSPRQISADAATIHTLAGNYRIPPRARPLLHAAMLAHHDRRGPAQHLFVRADGTPIGRQAMAHVLRRAAQFTGLHVPAAVTRAGTGMHRWEPFAAEYTVGAEAHRARPHPAETDLLIDTATRGPLTTYPSPTDNLSVASH